MVIANVDKIVTTHCRTELMHNTLQITSAPAHILMKDLSPLHVSTSRVPIQPGKNAVASITPFWENQHVNFNKIGLPCPIPRQEV